MGSLEAEDGHFAGEGPRRRVMIARPFAVGKFEVTFAEWDACAASGGCAPDQEGPYHPDDSDWGREDRPVINVSWQDAKRYVGWLHARVGGRSYRLLSEAKWEYAARAGTSTPFFTGTSITSAQAKFRPERLTIRTNRTDPVGTFAANAFRLHDMHGNVAEWVEDCHKSEYSGLPSDGSANITEGCSNRVVRGGGRMDTVDRLRSAYRGSLVPHGRLYDLGFRVARTL